MTFLNTCYIVMQLFILYYVCQLLLGAQQTNVSPSPDHLFLFGIISSLTLQNCLKMLSCYVGLAPLMRSGIRGGGKESLSRDNLAPFLREACFGFACTCTNTTLKDPLSILNNMYVLLKAISLIRSSFCCTHQLSLYSQQLFLLCQFQTSVNRTP